MWRIAVDMWTTQSGVAHMPTATTTAADSSFKIGQNHPHDFTMKLFFFVPATKVHSPLTNAGRRHGRDGRDGLLILMPKRSKRRSYKVPPFLLVPAWQSVVAFFR